MSRSLSSRGSSTKWSGTSQSGSDAAIGTERTRLISPEGRNSHAAPAGQRYMSTSESEHDVIIAEVRTIIIYIVYTHADNPL